MNVINRLSIAFILIITASIADASPNFSYNNSCDLIKSSFRNNIDTIIDLEMQNLYLKDDKNYREKYGAQYDEILSNYDSKILLKAIDAVSRNCPF